MTNHQSKSNNSNNTTIQSPLFTVHSTFRDKHGAQLFPEGLEWGMRGTSHVVYLHRNGNSNSNSNNNNNRGNMPNLDSHNVRRSLVEAHNRWAFAKQYRFKRVQDIASIRWVPGHDNHVQVEWQLDNGLRNPESLVWQRSIPELLEQDEAAIAASSEADAGQEVWINGRFVAMLNGPDTLPPILEAVNQTKSHRLCYRRSEGLIRIERMFKGYLMNRSIVFEHVLDNLIAMEDTQILDGSTLIGTATLPDWIMGGRLTSRIWVQSLPNGNIAFERPLFQDDISTSDRSFELVKGKDDEEIDIVRQELERLRDMAKTEHPFESSPRLLVPEEDPALEKRRAQHRVNSKRFFGL